MKGRAILDLKRYEDQSDGEFELEKKLHLEKISETFEFLEKQAFRRWVNFHSGTLFSTSKMTLIYDSAVAELMKENIPVSMSYTDFLNWYDTVC